MYNYLDQFESTILFTVLDLLFLPPSLLLLLSPLLLLLLLLSHLLLLLLFTLILLLIFTFIFITTLLYIYSDHTLPQSETTFLQVHLKDLDSQMINVLRQGQNFCTSNKSIKGVNLSSVDGYRREIWAR